MDLDHTPAMAAPPGQVSNLVNPYSRATSGVTVSSVALAIVTLFVATRIFVRRKIHNFNSEDWVLLLAAAEFIVLQSLTMFIALRGGSGTHMWNVSLSRLFETLYPRYIVKIMYSTTVFPIKYVLLQQIKATFFAHDRKNPFRRIIDVLIWVNLLLYISLMLASIFGCTPREKSWHPMIDGHCINEVASMSATAPLNILSHLSILIIPVFGVFKLKLPLRKKLLASSVFATGILAIAAVSVRVYYNYQLLTTKDVTWLMMDMGHWLTVEFTMGFIVAGSPYIPHMFEIIFGPKKQSQPTPAIIKTTFYGSKISNGQHRPGTSWTILQGQDDLSFNGTTQAYTRSDPFERV